MSRTASKTAEHQLIIIIHSSTKNDLS